MNVLSKFPLHLFFFFVLDAHALKLGVSVKKGAWKPSAVQRAADRFGEFIHRVGESVAGVEFKHLLDVGAWKKRPPGEYLLEDFVNSQDYWFSLYTKEKHLPYRNGVIFFVIKILAKIILLAHGHQDALCCAAETETRGVVCALGALVSSVKSCLLVMAFALTQVQDRLGVDLKCARRLG